MRLSTIQGDPGFKPFAELQKFRIFLNGVERFDCEIADEEKGFVQTVKYHRPAPWMKLRTIKGLILRGVVEIKAK